MYYAEYQLGGQIATVAMAVQIFLSKEYTAENFRLQKLVKRAVCAGYAIGLALVAAGLGDFGDEWWITGLSFLFGMLAFGAFLEFFKKVPLAPKDRL